MDEDDYFDGLDESDIESDDSNGMTVFRFSFSVYHSENPLGLFNNLVLGILQPRIIL